MLPILHNICRNRAVIADFHLFGQMHVPPNDWVSLVAIQIATVLH